MLKEHLRLSQQRMKKTSGQAPKGGGIIGGEWVYLKLRPYRQKSVAKRHYEKLAPRYFGPFKILQRVEAVAYRLELPKEATIHDVIHVCQLKKAVGQQVSVQPSLLPMTKSFEWVVEPKDVLGLRWSKELAKEQWLIKW